MDNTEITDKLMQIKPRTFFAIVFGLVTVTNSFTIIHQQITRTEENQVYNKDRADRIAERKLQEAKDYYHLQELKQELEQCKNK
jgi:hypothetical protein